MALDALVAEWLRWFAEVMPDTTPESFLAKFREEAMEFSDNPSLEEAVDVFTCLVGWIDRAGLSLHDLDSALEDKLRVNRNRTWERREDGTYKHVDPGSL